MQLPSLQEFLEARVTATLVVVSAALSTAKFGGYDLTFLIAWHPIWQAEPWRVLTTTLLHVNWIHLVFNLYWTAAFGVAIERRIGSTLTGVLVVVLAAASTLGEIAVFSGGIGLSGIGYGMFGYLWALARFDPSEREAMDRETTVLFVVWFFLCIGLTASGAMPVANMAHGVGALVGGLFGWRVASKEPRERATRSAALLAVLVLVGASATTLRPFVSGFNGMIDDVWASGGESLEDRERGVQEDPEDPWAWWNLGVAQWEVERHVEAFESFDRALREGFVLGEQREWMVSALVWQSQRIWLERGDRAHAEVYARRALEIDPDDDPAKQMLAVLERAR